MGNKEGIEGWEKWWIENKSTFKYPKWNNGYYYYYYSGENNFLDNLAISYWKNTYNIVKNIQYVDDRKNNKELIFIKKLLDNLNGASNVEITFESSPKKWTL